MSSRLPTPQPPPRRPPPPPRRWKDEQSGALSAAAAALAAFDSAHPPGGALSDAQRRQRGELEARLAYLKQLDKEFEDFGGHAPAFGPAFGHAFEPAFGACAGCGAGLQGRRAQGAVVPSPLPRCSRARPGRGPRGAQAPTAGRVRRAAPRRPQAP